MATAEKIENELELIAQLGLDDDFRPQEPRSIEDTGLNSTLVESLIVKYLLNVGSASGRAISDAVCLPFGILEATLARLRRQQHTTPIGSATLNDYTYALTESGRHRAHCEMQACAYVGPAPVPLATYNLSVEAQSLRGEAPNRARLANALKGISVDPRMFDKLGPAINSGKGLFLYGPPGNGKTTLARRITACYGQTILIPN
ncbi:MAG: hypothetical protein KDD44_10605, partial [Bdellovibrionales bacterium]|nr:hypothetical protein [Bdellovibrionales bacterium]